jgi:hypothetical protein
MDQRAGQQWLTSVLLATQQTEVKRIAVQSQLGQILRETLSRKNPLQKRAGEVAQGSSLSTTKKKRIKDSSV